MEGRYAKLVVMATVVALVATMGRADLFAGFNLCNLNQDAMKACSQMVNNQPSPECCSAVKGVDTGCICFLINSPFLAKNKEEGQRILGSCGVDPNLIKC